MAEILEIEDVSLRFGGVHALTHVSSGVSAGRVVLDHRAERRRQDLAGQLHFRPLPADRGPHAVSSGGDITRLRPADRASLGIGRTFQNLALFQHMSVLDNIMVGRHHLLQQQFPHRLALLADRRADRGTGASPPGRGDHRLPRPAVGAQGPAGTLSYGLRKRVELARAMAIEPELILLDEPMAGMNLEEKEDMARYIVDLNEEFGMTVIMIEHDMGVVMDISSRVMVLDFGRKIAEGRPEEVLADSHVRAAYLGEEDDACRPADAWRRRWHERRDRGAVAKADTFPKLLRLNASEHGGEIALREKDLGMWRAWTWRDYGDACTISRSA